MRVIIKDLIILTLLTIGSTIIVLLPFILQLKSFWGINYPPGGMQIIWRNFDGLNYIAVAKSLYNSEILAEKFSSLGLPPIYFASHFPAYPLLILLFSPLFGFLNSMLFVTLLFTILASWTFYLIVKEFNLTSSPLWLSFIFLILPARWVVVRSVGAPEPIFIFLILLSFLLIRKKQKLAASIAISLSVLVRSPAAILWLAINGINLLQTKLKIITKPTNLLIIFLPIITGLGLFWFYQIKYNDFFAYFHSGDNIHLVFPPWSVFNSKQFWVGTFWLENIIYIYLIVSSAILLLWKRGLYDFAIFTAIYLVAASFVVHLDIARYTIPTFPFVIIAFEKWLVKREFRLILLLLLIPIYLFVQNFLIGNVFPITDFTPFR
ncbi:MAG: hypothetical protein QXO27_04175 [Candidatus Aenigmatarchaeota archaeon]